MKITPLRIAAFIVLVVAFFGYFGSVIPARSAKIRGIDDAWFYCAVLFLTGAASACFGDQEIGMFPPSSLRWMYVAVGIVIMLVSAAWMTSIVRISHRHHSSWNAPAQIFAQWS